jgi:hypothetical protein
MPMSASEAARKYRQGINSVGIDAYRRASNTNSPQEAAQILEQAKENNSMSLDAFATKYRNAYSGGGGDGDLMG